MQPFTLRMSDENREYLKQCAQESGTSLNTVIETLIDACRRRGWRVTKATGAQVREPD